MCNADNLCHHLHSQSVKIIKNIKKINAKNGNSNLT